jgi:hypothetical protein
MNTNSVKIGRIFVVALVGMMILAGNTWALDWTYEYDPVNDASGGKVYEVYRMGYAFDDDFLYFNMVTGLPQQGNKYGSAWVNAGDLFLNVGGSLLDGYDGSGENASYTSGQVFGLGLTDHVGDMNTDLAQYRWANSGEQDNNYDWDAVAEGHLYSDAIFSTGVYEGYERSGYGRRDDNPDGGRDPFGGANNAPSHIAEFGLDLGFQGDVSWDDLGTVARTENGVNVAKDGNEKKAYEVNAKVSLEALGIRGGETIEMWWAMECGNDYDMIRAVAPHSPVPEPGTMLLLGVGLVGLVAIHRRKR